MSDPSVALPPDVPVAGGWKLWPSILLRGAGFPVRLLEPLAARSVVPALDAVLAIEDRRTQTLQAALAICAQPHNEDREAWRKAHRALRKGGSPEAAPPDAELTLLLGELAGSDRELSDARNALAAACDEDLDRISRSLIEIARDPRFREALIWQNPEAFRTSINDLAHRDLRAIRQGKFRKRALAAVSYLQRYCAKNDSIGFFGPVGWSRWDTGISGTEATAGPQLVRQRFFRFEHWAIDQLSSELLRRFPDLKKWLPPRRNPRLGISGQQVLLADGRTVKLEPRYARLLALCDGRTPAREVARRATRNAAESFSTEQGALAAIAGLVEARWLLWDCAVAASYDSDEKLRDLLSTVGDEEIRAPALEVVTQLDLARRNVAHAAGDPESLERAMADLERRFTAVTGSAPNRHPGKTYAGRTLVYHDCVRDLDLRLGSGPLDALALPLSIVLRSADWYVNAIWAEFARRIHDLIAREQNQTGRNAIRLDRFLINETEAQPIAAEIVANVAAELQRRWMQLTKPDTGARRWQCDPESLGGLAGESFRIRDPQSYLGRYHSPDLMIAASSIEQIGSGNYLWVLGEVHAGTNTQLLPVIMTMHPDPQELFARVARERRQPRVWMMRSRHMKGGRIGHGLRPAGDVTILGDDTPADATSDSIPIGDLVIVESGGALSVRSLDGRRRFQVRDFFRIHLQTLCATSFSLFPKLPHLPRITVGKLVIQREQWRFPCRELAFSKAPELVDRFTLALRWLRAHGLPRRMFARVRFEMKPVFVDFHSPYSVEILAKLVNKAHDHGPEEMVTLTEMLPEPEQCWLPDAQGNRYTCELRIVAVDPEPAGGARPAAAGRRVQHAARAGAARP